MSALRTLRILLAAAAFAATGSAAAPQSPLAQFEAPRIVAEMFQAVDGTVLPMRSWLPDGEPRMVVLALHGFGDYSAAFRLPAGFWANQGVATFAFDQRGFGGAPHAYEWAGTDTMSSDLRSVARSLRRRYPGIPLYLLGESMGGALALANTTGVEPMDVDGVILVSAAVWEHNLMGSIERAALWMTRLTVPGLWLEPPRGLGIHPSDNIDMLRANARDSLVHLGARVDATAGLMDLMDEAQAAVVRIRLPTLVLFGAHEEVLPRAGVESFLNRLPKKSVRVAYYPDGYHMLLRDLHGDVVAKDVLAWMRDRAAPLPSGNECAGLGARAAACAAF